MTKLTDISVFLQNKHIKPLSMINLTDVSLFFRLEVILLIMQEKSFCILKLFVWKSYIYKTLYLYFWCYQTIRFAESRYQHDWNTGFTLNYSSKLQLQLEGRTGSLPVKVGRGGLARKRGCFWMEGWYPTLYVYYNCLFPRLHCQYLKLTFSFQPWLFNQVIFQHDQKVKTKI